MKASMEHERFTTVRIMFGDEKLSTFSKVSSDQSRNENYQINLKINHSVKVAATRI